MDGCRYFRIVAIAILLVGLGSAIMIYFQAESTAVDVFNPMASKAYLRELQLYGGKFNVLAAELSQWFGGLWHGRRLAYTVGVLTLFLSALFWFVRFPRKINDGR
jgi:hypothetical protein